jgi:hypothetical protein
MSLRTIKRRNALLSFFALLLCRVTETRAKDTGATYGASWSASTSATSTAALAACTSGPSSPRQREILAALDVPGPPRFLTIEPSNRA